MFKQYIKWNGDELIAVILGFIAGIAFCVILYIWYIEPNLVKEWEARAIKVGVGEYYKEGGVEKFRYLTERVE